MTRTVPTRHKRRRGEFDPWIEGYEARTVLRARSANPYRDPDAGELWDQGWLEAEAEQTQKHPRLARPEDDE